MHFVAALAVLCATTTLVYAQDDLEIMRERRKPFIHESVLNVQDAPSWLASIAEDGTWADVNYLAGRRSF